MEIKKQFFSDERACESVDAFYHGKSSFLPCEMLEFKASVGALLNQLERVFRGIFGKGYETFNENDLSKFKRIFPTAWDVFSKIYPEDTAKSIRIFLSVSRNINSHARDLSTHLIFRVKEKGVVIPNQNKKIKMVGNDGFLTLGGLLTLLFMFSNAKMVEYFVKSSQSFKTLNLIIKPVDHQEKMRPDDYGEFIQEKIGMKDEELIREPSETKDVFEAIFENAGKVHHNGIYFQYFNGDNEENSDYIVSGSYSKKGSKHILKINAGSIYIKSFKDDFIYSFKDENEFINECLKYPPFIYILLLQKCEGLTKEEYEKSYPLFEKLNRPKFYVDKSIDILFFGSKFADFRGMGALLLPTVNYCFLNLEDTIYGFNKGLLGPNDYSRLQEALLTVGVNKRLTYNVGMLRNYLSHGYNIGDDYITSRKEIVEINFNYIVDLLIELGKELNRVSLKNGSIYMGDIYHRVIARLVAYKYYDSVKLSQNILMGAADENDYNQLKTKNIRVASSYLTNDVEEKLASLGNGCLLSYNGVYFESLYVLDVKGKKVINNIELNDITLYLAGSDFLEKDLGINSKRIRAGKRVGFKQYIEIVE